MLAMMAASCKKATTDTSEPSITISSPTEGQNLMQMTTTDSATLTVHITDQDLHSYSILIEKETGGDTLLYVPETHQEENDLHISEKFPLHVVSGTVLYVVTVDAEDHSSNEGEEQRNFTVTHM